MRGAGGGATRAADSGGGAAARLPARLAVLAVLAVVALLFLALGEGGLAVIVSGLAGLGLCAVGVWWFLAYRGAVRLLGALVAVAAPAAVLAFFTLAGLWRTALVLVVCWAAALGCAQAALRAADRRRPPRTAPAPPPRRPVLIMNPRSGGGKVGRFRLVERAEALGARVILLDPDAPADVAALAREAVADGADLLGVAGGDGTQALVAAVAAAHDLPFVVISAGTRNHFALDLGLDRTDPARCLDALTDGEDLRVDLGDVAGRAFVNTVSFGVYADVVQRPEYRDAKAGTALTLMPDLLTGDRGPRLDGYLDGQLDVGDPGPGPRPGPGVQAPAGVPVAPGATLTSQQALLISNNPYASPDDLGAAGRRPRLDTGTLGVLGIRVESAARAAELAVLGAQSTALTVLTAHRVTVTAATADFPVAVDGEALRMPTPVICTLRPRALRVRVPRTRPGTVTPTPPMDWRRVGRLARGGSG
ncbi:diacylglycerol/lipid kinase family protein [Streptomyces catenulae]|uniref:Diacylglycerol kinase family protein n=1 Tax=Streptomyces catenulae TaxID=66875 RepID=A0ABV2YXI0_9ACTN|nr:diacylglycerol kinase family protein [Streptomyces catenulae]